MFEVLDLSAVDENSASFEEAPVLDKIYGMHGQGWFSGACMAGDANEAAVAVEEFYHELLAKVLVA